MPVVSTSHENEKNIVALLLKRLSTSVSSDVFHHKQLHPSLLSGLRADVTQACQNSSGEHDNATRPRVFADNAACHFLCICAFRLFSNGYEVAM